jgi:hypothetical protein
LKGSDHIQGFQFIKTTKENRRKMKGLQRYMFSGFQGGYLVNYGRRLSYERRIPWKIKTNQEQRNLSQDGV